VEWQNFNAIFDWEENCGDGTEKSTGICLQLGMADSRWWTHALHTDSHSAATISNHAKR